MTLFNSNSYPLFSFNVKKKNNINIDIDEEIERIESIQAKMVDTTFYQGFAQQFTKKEALLLLKQRRDERLHDKMEELERETKRGFNEEDWEKEEREKKNLIERQKKDLEKKEKLIALELEKKLKEQKNNEEENANQDNSNEAMADFLKNQRKRETNAQRQQRLAAEKMNEMMEMRERHFAWKLKSVRLKKNVFEILVLITPM